MGLLDRTVVLFLAVLSVHQTCACVRATSLQSCPAICGPTDCSPPGFFVHRILHAGVLEWVAMPSSRGPSQPRDQTRLSYVLAGGFSTTSATWQPHTKLRPASKPLPLLRPPPGSLSHPSSQSSFQCTLPPSEAHPRQIHLPGGLPQHSHLFPKDLFLRLFRGLLMFLSLPAYLLPEDRDAFPLVYIYSPRRCIVTKSNTKP